MTNDVKPGYDDLTKLRFEYAWRYFESAANQRMLFFNYFLIAVGILASAYGFALKEKFYPLAAFVSLFGLWTSFAFVAFDMRMLAFVERALDVLDTLERECIFPDGYGYHGTAISAEKKKQLGLARIEPDREAAGNMDLKTGHPVTKVKVWIRSVELLAAGGCTIGFIYALSLWCAKAS
jgi:hypothetical protein